MGLTRRRRACTRNENPGQFNTPHNIGVDRQNNVYVADRGNRRIQVFDRDGKFQRIHFLNAPYDKKRHPVLGNTADECRPTRRSRGRSASRNTPTQYLYTSDQEPGRIYKLTLDGKILGMLGESGHDVGQFNWIHGLACPSENTALRRRHEQLARAADTAASRSNQIHGGHEIALGWGRNPSGVDVRFRVRSAAKESESRGHHATLQRRSRASLLALTLGALASAQSGR